MKLYCDPIATTCRPVTFLIEYRKIPIEHQVVSLFAEEHLTPAFRALNPKGRLPVLDDDGFILTECTAILQYLALRHTPDLYPDDAHSRARINEAMNWFATDVNLAMNVMTAYPKAFGVPAGLTPQSAANLAGIAAPAIDANLALLDRQLAGQAHVAGDRLSIADFQGLAYLTLSALIGFDFAPWPNVTRWIQGMQALQGWNEAYAVFNELIAARAVRAAS